MIHPSAKVLAREDDIVAAVASVGLSREKGFLRGKPDP